MQGFLALLSGLLFFGQAAGYNQYFGMPYLKQLWLLLSIILWGCTFFFVLGVPTVWAALAAVIYGATLNIARGPTFSDYDSLIQVKKDFILKGVLKVLPKADGEPIGFARWLSYQLAHWLLPFVAIGGIVGNLLAGVLSGVGAILGYQLVAPLFVRIAPEKFRTTDPSDGSNYFGAFFAGCLSLLPFLYLL